MKRCMPIAAILCFSALVVILRRSPSLTEEGPGMPHPARLRKGLELFESGLHEQAIEVFSEIIKKEPQLAVATAGGGTADAAAVPRSRRRMSLTFQRTLEGYFFVSPWVVGFVIFMAWPLFQSFFLFGVRAEGIKG